jgi:hypothetical protein
MPHVEQKGVSRSRLWTRAGIVGLHVSLVVR